MRNAIRDAIRNVIDLLINPYRAFMRIESKATFDAAQYGLYILSVLILESGKSGLSVVVEVMCICLSSFLMGWIFMQVVRLCGGELCYWRSLNAQVCMATLANMGDFFELGSMLKMGGAISFAVNIYCVYLHIRCVVEMSRVELKRVIIVYVTIFVVMIAIIYTCFGLLAGTIISESGYIG